MDCIEYNEKQHNTYYLLYIRIIIGNMFKIIDNNYVYIIGIYIPTMIFY